MSLTFGKNYLLRIYVRGNLIQLSPPIRCEFTINKAYLPSPNKANINIWNLNKDTANRLKEQPAVVFLDVGYGNNLKSIFQGDVLFSTTYREEADSITQIIAQDGGISLYSQANITYAKGTPLKKISTELIKKMGFSVGKNDLPNTGILRGVSQKGDIRDFLTSLLGTEYRWYIEDGQANIIKINNNLGLPILDINQQSGIIAIPELTSFGLNLRVLINPNIKVGRLVRVSTTDIKTDIIDPSLTQIGRADQARLSANGVYLVNSLVHRGDTRSSQTYETNFIAQAADNLDPNN